MGQALYRKYRSKSLSEIVGQEHVTTTLANAIKAGRISHAYLLSGPRGVGKTSIARILAHEINSLPYDDESHLDIIEIDAASNRRIDEIRELREKVNTAPAHAKFKVYIIDEVHMLTKEAFNALLKTLEEPPSHVVFILATTEAHKLPDTIISRTQRYSLRPVPEPQVIDHLKFIAKNEKISITDEAIALIAKHGEGSFRDSISLLDQASSTNVSVTRADIEHILGLAPDEYIAKLIENISDHASAQLVAALAELYNQGYEAPMIAQQLSLALRTILLSGEAAQHHLQLDLLKKLLDIPASRNPKQLLEIVLLQSTFANDRLQQIPTPTSKPSVSQALPKTASSAPAKPITEPAPVEPVRLQKKHVQKPEIAPPAFVEPLHEKKEVLDQKQTDASIDTAEAWQQTLNEIKKQYNTLYGIARMATADFNGDTLTLSFKFSFHQKRVNEAKNRSLIASTFEKIYGQHVTILCVISEATVPAPSQPLDVSNISNIFGGAELLES